MNIYKHVLSLLGLAAFELGSALVWTVQKSIESSASNNKGDNDQRQSYLSEAIACYEKASEILSFEPPGTNHSIVGQTAAKELQKLKLEI